MMFDVALAIGFALGLWGLVIVGVNVLHGLGIKSRWTEPFTLLVFALAGLATIVVGGWLVRAGWAGLPVAVRVGLVFPLFVGFVVVPTVVVARRFRVDPAGVEGRSRRIDLAERMGREALIGAGLNARLLRLPRNQALQLELADWRVRVPGLPRALEGLSILHLTDLHCAPGYRRAFFEAVVEEAMREEPDLVLFTGDAVDHDAAIAWLGPILGRARGRVGQYGILGNHDCLHHPDRVAEALEAAGLQMLDGRWSRVEVGDATIGLGGTAAPWGPLPDPHERPEADLTILLSHSPDQVYRAREWGVDLVLSGHNHGGQVRLPGIGPVLMPSRYSRRFDRGFFRVGPTLMYVGQGVGAKHPIRYGAPPEVARLVLVGAPARADGPALGRVAAGRG